MHDKGYLTAAMLSALETGNVVMVQTEGERRVAVVRGDHLKRDNIPAGVTDVVALDKSEVDILTNYAVHDAPLGNGNVVTLMVAEHYANRMARITDMEVRERIQSLERWVGIDEAKQGASWTVLARIDTLEKRVDVVERRIDEVAQQINRHQRVIDMNTPIG